VSEQNAVPLVVVSTTRDPVEAINSILRRAGEPVHCTWLEGARDLAETIAQVKPQLLIHVGRAQEKLKTILDIRDRIAPELPLIIVTDTALDEARIGELIAQGARDAVSLPSQERLGAVLLRELRAFKAHCELETTKKALEAAREEMKSLLERSADAIACVQEGILVEANRTWLMLLDADESIIGEPLMDHIEEASQATLRQALTASLHSRAAEHTVQVNARHKNARPLAVSVRLVPGEYDGEPCVRLVVPAAQQASGQAAAGEAGRGDEAPGTGTALTVRGSPEDRIWVKLVRTALLENRFRLVQQPIASLSKGETDMFDVLLHMIDPGGRVIPPAAFMAAAERYDLTRNIDRWVVGASLLFAAQRRPGCLFVRLSRDTACDGGFVAWLDKRLTQHQAEPGRLCFKLTEAVAVRHFKAVQDLSAALHERGFRFALEGFGTRRDSAELLERLPLDFVKLDAALLSGLAADGQLQNRVRMLLDAAARRRIRTIGEAIEDTGTMSLLWQAGLKYIQGPADLVPHEQPLRAER
jgi:EAL domain-containing protein (putative c-di-GMP-specific phosphodiesterase class I)